MAVAQAVVYEYLKSVSFPAPATVTGPWIRINTLNDIGFQVALTPGGTLTGFADIEVAIESNYSITSSPDPLNWIPQYSRVGFTGNFYPTGATTGAVEAKSCPYELARLVITVTGGTGALTSAGFFGKSHG